MKNTLHFIVFVFLCIITHTFASAQTTIRLKPLASADDAEQNLTTGAVQTNSSDLELGGYDWDSRFRQSSGIRFPNVVLPQGATITKAYIQFSVDETYAAGNTANMTIKAQRGNAATYATTANNISSRSYTTATVNWVNAPWTVLNQRLAAQQTPDLKAIVLEAMQTGFVSGNALAFCFTTINNGYATAYPIDRGAANAPELVIEYTTPAPLSITADKASGTYTTPFTVALTATVGTTIRYTTNGTTPTATTGTVYSAPIPVSATTTIRAIAVSTNNVSTVLSLNYVFAACASTTNLALNKPTQQSSTFPGGESTKAVDGNTNGIWNNNSVTHTDFILNSWWQVDVGQVSNIDVVKLFNRTDCCAERLSNFYVFVSETPFSSTDLNTTLAQSTVKSYYFAGTVGTQTDIPFNTKGRYVRVQLKTQNNLSLAEVQVIGCGIPVPRTALSNIFINEIAASGSATNKFDWIELHNANNADVSLDSVFVSDNAALPFKYQFKNGFLGRNGFTTISADGDLLTSTNDIAAFGISSTKPNTIYLTQVFNGITTRLDSLNTVPMTFNTSYGRQPDGSNTFNLFANPTPFRSNNNAKQLADMTFSHQRGIQAAAFNLTITAPAGMTIRYATNGSVPNATTGTIYTTPIAVNQNMIFKVFAYDATRETKVTTQTYIINSGLTSASYTQQQLNDALKDLPIVCLGTTASDANGTEAGCSFEFINKFGENKSTFVDAGFRIFGNTSINYPKKNYRVYFRSEYGYNKLKHKVYEKSSYENYAPTEDFDALDLKAGTDFMPPGAQYWGLGGLMMSDYMAHELLRRMGNKDIHARFVHMFFNGKYYGLYILREHFNQNYMKSYYGGEDTEYEVIDGTYESSTWPAGITNQGTGTQWAETKQVATTNFQELKKKVDVKQYIDMMLGFFFTDMEHEYRVAAHKNYQNTKFVVMHNDTDGFLALNSELGAEHHYNTKLDVQSAKGPGDIMTLAGIQGGTFNLEYRTMVRDRVQDLYVKQDGLITTTGINNFLKESRNMVYNSAMLETTRWNFYTRNAWSTRIDNIINTMQPRMTDVMNFFRTNNWVHSLQAPTLSKQSGDLAIGEKVFITNPNPNTVLYYTTDGTDVVLDNVVSPSAILYNATAGITLPLGKTKIRARAYATGNFGMYADAEYVVSRPIKITAIAYQPNPKAPVADVKANDVYEFFNLTNTGTTAIDISSFMVTEAIDTFRFPVGTSIAVGETLMLCADDTKYPSVSNRKFKWVKGKLADGGENISFRDNLGNLINEVKYDTLAPWPYAKGNGLYISLKSWTLDNKLGGNWEAVPLSNVSTPTVLNLLNKGEIFTVEGRQEGYKAIVSWVSKTDKEVDYFVVERLNLDANIFEKLETVNAKPSTAKDVQFYSISDNAPVKDINIYRVGLVGQGATPPQYSAQIALDFSQFMNYVVSPNPAIDYVDIDIADKKLENVQIRIVNFLGKTVLQQQVSQAKGSMRVSVESLEAGSYILFMESKGKRSVAKKLNIVR